MNAQFSKVERYNQHPSGIECIQVVERMSFCLGNAVKYLWRAGHKDDVLDELQKAQYYVLRAIEVDGLYTDYSHDRQLSLFCRQLEPHDRYGYTKAIRLIIAGQGAGSLTTLQKAARLIRWCIENYPALEASDPPL